MRNPSYRTMIRATVTRVTRLTPSFVSITLHSEAMGEFDYLGFDQAVRLFLPRAGQNELRLPAATGNRWIAKFFLTPTSIRPHVRNYTIRAHRPEAKEVDIEFVTHGDDGPASAWAGRARPGDGVGLFPEGIQYLPNDEVTTHLLVAEESAVPAILSILDHAADSFRAEVFCEVPTSEDVRDIPFRDGVRMHWLPRNGSGEIPGRRALDTVRQSELPNGEIYCFLAGESGLPTGLRRHLVAERGIAKSSITFVGYWKYGKAAVG
ncbi:siderophore-interacting protein [Brevibacterium aurantiacum]|uniref:Siderophore-interacting protein n=1 Tax=Brevibacterium aurantiacum TaxID=273384 RepID=A0A556CB87_BREAU|nr:siderophore-interacting protein [Brevibacterium aurantiacum]